MRVLIVDDEIMLVRSLRRFLGMKGLTVFVAGSGDEALEILTEQEVDVVISDIIMTPMDGTELIKAIRKLYPDMIVIVMTGILNVSATVQELENGADGYLIKPFSNLNYVWEVLQPWIKKFGIDGDTSASTF